MYTALVIMISAMVAGRVLRNFISGKTLHFCVLGSVFMLLFLLGVSIGSNRKLLDQLSWLGMDAFIIMIFCVAGSIVMQIILKKLHAFRKNFPDKN